MFGGGLADERYVVERFQAMADGDIRRAPGDQTPATGVPLPVLTGVPVEPDPGARRFERSAFPLAGP